MFHVVLANGVSPGQGRPVQGSPAWPSAELGAHCSPLPWPRHHPQAASSQHLMAESHSSSRMLLPCSNSCQHLLVCSHPPWLFFLPCSALPQHLQFVSLAFCDPSHAPCVGAQLPPIQWCVGGLAHLVWRRDWMIASQPTSSGSMPPPRSSHTESAGGRRTSTSTLQFMIDQQFLKDCDGTCLGLHFAPG